MYDRTCRCLTFFFRPVEASASRQYSRIFWVGFLFRFLSSRGVLPGRTAPRPVSVFAVCVHDQKYFPDDVCDSELTAFLHDAPCWRGFHLRGWGQCVDGQHRRILWSGDFSVGRWRFAGCGCSSHLLRRWSLHFRMLIQGWGVRCDLVGRRGERT